MILIQCTNSKRDEPTKARNLYDESQYFRAMRDYAEATGEQWYILSAKHGLVDPETELAPYDEVGLSEHQATEIADEITRGPAGYVEIIAGTDYTEPLVPELKQRGITVVELCKNDRIGTRVQKLKQKTAKITHNTLC